MATDPKQGRPSVPNRYGVIRFTIGLVPDLYEWVCDLAEQEERTVQAQIAYILKEKRRAMDDVRENFRRGLDPEAPSLSPEQFKEKYAEYLGEP